MAVARPDAGVGCPQAAAHPANTIAAATYFIAFKPLSCSLVVADQ